MQDGTPGANPTDDVASAAADDPGPGELAIFVDPTGGRHRRTRRIAVTVSLLCAGFVGTAALGLTGTGPLSGSPILTPALRALDGLGVPHPGGTPTGPVAVAAASAGPTEAARQSSTGGGRATAVLSRASGPRVTPSPSADRPSPSPSPTPSPTATVSPASAKVLPVTPGSDHRATPTPPSTPRGRPSPTPTSA